jgi:uncharacterized membrane protein
MLIATVATSVVSTVLYCMNAETAGFRAWLHVRVSSVLVLPCVGTDIAKDSKEFCEIYTNKILKLGET